MFGRVLCFSIRALAAVAVVASCLQAGVCEAYAAWPLESAGGVGLGYGVAYVRDGRSVTHTGMDISGPEGVSVLAPVAGEVTFCGRVPSGAGTVLALTIATGDGLKLTLMPLLTASVVEGQQVDESEPLATLAGIGDPSSSSESHLHVGLRRGDAYLDPSTLLGAAGTVPADDESEVPQELPVAATVMVPAPSEQPAVGASAGAVADPVSAQAPQPVGDVSSSGAVANQPRAQDVAARPNSQIAASARSAVAPSLDVTTVRAMRAQAFRTPHTSALPRVGVRRPGRSAPALALLAAGAMALWPLWRKRGHPVPDVRPRFDDVAAAVSR